MKILLILCFAGGTSAIDELIQTIERMAEDSKIIIDQAVQALDQEEEADNIARSTYRDRWTRYSTVTTTQ